MDYLAEAKKYARHAQAADGGSWAQFNAQLANAHALIAIAERLPPPAETWSEMYARLQEEGRAQEEEQDGA